jgi:hypothetical protein
MNFFLVNSSLSKKSKKNPKFFLKICFFWSIYGAGTGTGTGTVTLSKVGTGIVTVPQHCFFKISQIFFCNYNHFMISWRLRCKHALIKKKRNFPDKEIQMGSVAKSSMRKGVLIYVEMRKYLITYEEAFSHL